MALTSAYSFDEARGSLAIDSSGNGRDITVSSTAWTTGKRGWGLAGNSASNVTLGPSSASNRTLMCWFMINSNTGDSQTLVLSQPGGSNLNVLYVDPNGAGPWILGYYDQTTGLDISGTFSLSFGTWYHAAVTTGTGGIKVYLNGSLLNSNASTVSRGLTNAYIGSDASNNAVLDGSIDDLRTFDTVLTAGEITTYMDTPVWMGPYISGCTTNNPSGNLSNIYINPVLNLASGSLSDGDWIIVVLTSASGSSNTNIPSPPGDWTTLVAFTGVGSGTTCFGAWAHKRAAGETGYNWPQTTGTNNTSYRSFYVSGAGDVSTWVIGSFNFRENTGTTSTNVAASITTVANDTFALMFSEERTIASETDAQVTCTNFNKIYFDNTNSLDHILIAATKNISSPGSTGSSTITYPNTHAYNGIAGIIGIPPIETLTPLMWVT